MIRHLPLTAMEEWVQATGLQIVQLSVNVPSKKVIKALLTAPKGIIHKPTEGGKLRLYVNQCHLPPEHKSYEIAVNDPLPSAISVCDTARCQHHCTNFIPWQLCLSSRFFGTLTLDNSVCIWDERLPTGRLWSPLSARGGLCAQTRMLFPTCIKHDWTRYARQPAPLSHGIAHYTGRSDRPQSL